MATIRKRGSYQWEAQIRRKGYPAQSKTFNTKAEAEAWAAVLESEMARGVWTSRTEAETTTLIEALERYESDILPGKKEAEPERSVIRTWMMLPIARRTVASIRGADIANVRDNWLKHYKPATVLRRLAVLSRLFNVARKEWGMESLSNPVELVRKPQPNNARTRRLASVEDHFQNGDGGCSGPGRLPSNGELERITAASESALLPAIMSLAVETAMRRSEIVDLTWEHVDLARRVAHLPATKNGHSRDVPLSPRAVGILEALYRATRSTEGHSARRVFAIRSDAVTRAFERAVARARSHYVDECRSLGQPIDAGFLTDLRFHDLRHEATSRLATVFALHELTKITGHRDPRMLMRYYHPRAEELAQRLG